MLVDVTLEPHGVLCTYIGHSNLQDILEAAKRYLTHPDCGGFRYTLHNFTAVEEFSYSEVSFAGLVRYANLNYQDSDYVPRCAVTDNETVRRSLELYSELTGRKWEFVTTLSEARIWATAHSDLKER